MKNSGVPLGLWVGLVAVGFILYGAYRLFPPAFDHSSPQITVNGTVLSVEFDAVNHSGSKMSRGLGVTIGTVRGGRSTGPRWTPADYREITVNLRPLETRRVRCDFPNPGWLQPNGAEITVLR